MRQTLIRVLLDRPWAFWVPDRVTGIEGIGIAWLLCIAMAGWFGWRTLVDKQRPGKQDFSTYGAWIGAIVVATFLGPRLPLSSFPIFGYGFLMLTGFLAGALFAQRRAKALGYPDGMILDVGFWMMAAGVIGGRTFYLIQYADRVYKTPEGVPLQGFDILLATINLTEGGLVLIGGLVCGATAFFAFCKVRNVHPLELADLLTPSVFIGVAFGRLGCLMNGCCWGDVCELPWAITFPHGSVPFSVLAERGLFPPDAAHTVPLHPTQIYSSINGFILAFLTAAYYPHRQRTGSVFALGCMTYAVTRFTIEYLRSDEIHQFGTGLTISQLYSLAIFTIGAVLMVVVHRSGWGRRRTLARG